METGLTGCIWSDNLLIQQRGGDTRGPTNHVFLWCRHTPTYTFSQGSGLHATGLVGVFAAEFIPANIRVYYYETTYYNKEETIAYLASLSSDEERRRWLEHAYGYVGKIGIEYDDSDMINHSNNPTITENPNDDHSYTT